MKKLLSCLVLFAIAGSMSAVDLVSGVAGFRGQPYWGGKTKITSENGKKILELTSTFKNGFCYGRAFLPYYTKEKLAVKDKIVASATVRGKGKFFIGVLKYRPNIGMPVTVFVEPVDLTETAKEVKFVFELDEAFARVTPYVQTVGKGTVFVENFKLEKVNDSALQVSKVIPPLYDIVKAKPADKVDNSKVPLMSGIASFRDQPYWGGKAAKVRIDGKNVLELSSTTRNGRTFGRAFASYGTKEVFLPNSEIIATAKVRGTGKFFVGILAYRPAVGAPVTKSIAPIELTDTAKEVVFKYKLDSFYDRIYPYLQVDGTGKVIVESFKLEKFNDKAVKVTVSTPLQIVTPEMSAEPVKFQTSCKNTNIDIVKFNIKNPVISTIKSDKNGTVVIPSAKYPAGTNHVYASVNGTGVKSFVSVVSKEDYDKTDAIAREIKLEKPVRILMLGDSLSDFYRGYNYIDRLNFWMNKYNPGKFSFHNAGVGGDFLERASNRMEVELKHQTKWVYRQNMYNGIFKNEYDYVFIFMGQNDTRCMPATKYEVPETTQAEQQKYLTLMLRRLRKNCPKAKIVLISPSPSNEALFNDHLAKGRKVAFYGKKKFVDAYDAFNREFCAKNKLDYIDITTAMRSYNPLKDLYVSDGVHLSDKGGIIIADKLLEYFAKK